MIKMIRHGWLMTLVKASPRQLRAEVSPGIKVRRSRCLSTAQELRVETPSHCPEHFLAKPRMQLPVHHEVQVRGKLVAASSKNSEPSLRAPNSSNVMRSLSESPFELAYIGEAIIPITSILHIVAPGEDTPRGVWPIFRLMDENGNFRNPSNDGYPDFPGRSFEHSSSVSSHNSVTQSSAPKPDDDQSKISFKENLDWFREYLHRQHPFLNLDENPLLKSAKYEYPDTASTNTLLRAYTQMIRLRQMDNMLQNAQRQGRIPFYMTSRGEEAIHFGSAAALSQDDVVLAQYREPGVLMWRGFTLQQFADQCFSNMADLGKARQMPVHYGSRALNFQTISSPLGTQLPQAVGAAYRSKLERKSAVTIVFFGDGCASTVDFHSACNFATTLQAPVIFFCRNNGYAISTPVSEQYSGDGVISRCKGYGMAGLRVDGNDLFAVGAAVQAAKNYALANSAPVMIEAMTYRQGHHSTSDDSSRYRNDGQAQSQADRGDPFIRLRLFLRDNGILNFDDTTRIEDTAKFNVLKAIQAAERKRPPAVAELFEDVYKIKPNHLERQENQLLQHIQMKSADGKTSQPIHLDKMLRRQS